MFILLSSDVHLELYDQRERERERERERVFLYIVDPKFESD